MICTLMHKNVPVVDMSLDDATAYIKKNGKLYNPDHLPVGVGVKNGAVDRGALNDWWLDRCIPASRSGIRQALEMLNVANTKMLILRCLGLSLSDQYWIKPQGADIDWHEVNFFENPFSEDIGDILLGSTKKERNFDFNSPDNTSDGCLKKRWKIIDGKRCLIKAGSGPFFQQPFNEVAASLIMERLSIPHIGYSLIWDGDIPYSVCEDFITDSTELVSAWRIMQTQKKANSTSLYRHYINCCEFAGIKDIVQSVNQMIVVDYLIANEDRHQNNFGLLRNADTLEWIGTAPIFDSGSSLGYDKVTPRIGFERGITCKPFKKSHSEQLKLVSDFSWIDFDSLKGVDKELNGIFSRAGEYVDDNRRNAIVLSVMRRIETLKNIALSGVKYEDSTENDVERDIAEDYTGK